MSPDIYGMIEASPVHLHEITAPNGARARIISYGARLVEWLCPDPRGAIRPVTLSRPDLAGYRACTAFMGATCGRFANRIDGGRVTIDGKVWHLDRNDGANTLHGGAGGFDSRVWRFTQWDSASARLELISKDEDMGFPGTARISVTYAFTPENALTITMEAETTQATVMNLAHHSYFNLSGAETILDHEMQIGAEHYTPTRADQIPTGEIRPVAGSALDFRHGRAIGAAMPGPDGFDHNFCLSEPPGPDGLRLAATLRAPETGRTLSIRTDAPGLQVYTGAHLDPAQPGLGRRIGRFGGIALETQNWPDAPNHSGFPSALLRPGEIYRHRMEMTVTDPAYSASTA
ncbi:aldose epimerase family protein [Pseudothioclava nitratireducens]|uniref:aldose epimerase family protein n=1 Tax=Pseudothioclava nitratireducens TaxID=1928646 RepID=UPI0023D9C08F|nr:aldose epimerase family protein [Defluviimonas nitratireducens]MDF1621256.1 galactose mutarotase [Defluviimonas nitratireducens]